MGMRRQVRLPALAYHQQQAQAIGRIQLLPQQQQQQQRRQGGTRSGGGGR